MPKTIEKVIDQLPLEITSLQEKTLSNTEQYLEKIDCLKQKIANIENKLTAEKTLSSKLKLELEVEDLKSELYFLNIQILAFNKNIERIENFKNQKDNFILQQKQLIAKKKWITF